MGADFPKPSQITEGDAEEPKWETIEALVQNGADINYMDPSGHNALMYAAFEGKADCVRLLARAGADLNLANRYYHYTPLMLACINGVVECIEALVEEGADLSVVNDHGEQALQHCAMYGCVEGMRCLLKAGADVNKGDYRGITTLMNAAMFGDSEEPARCAVMCGARVNQTDMFGRTALVHAAIKGSLKTLKYLVDVGADVNTKDYDGKTALIHAVESHDALPSVKYLISAEAEVNEMATCCGSRYRGSYSALTSAVVGRNSELVEFLVQHGAKVRAELHLAVNLDDLTTVKTLVNNGAFPTVQPPHLFPFLPNSVTQQTLVSPAQVAIQCQKPALLQYFLDTVFFVEEDSQIFYGNHDSSSTIATTTTSTTTTTETATATATAADTTHNNNEDQMSAVLKDLRSVPRSLVFLSLYKISLVLGFDEGRKTKVEQLNLPSVFQRKFMFQG